MTAPLQTFGTLVAPAQALARRLAAPFFLFSVVLASLLFLSQSFLLPLFTKVEIGGEAISLSEVRAKQTALAKELDQKETQRSNLLISVHDELYTALKNRKRGGADFLTLRTDLLRVLKDAPGGDSGGGSATGAAAGGGEIFLSKISYDAANETLWLSGDVRGVGPRSMTVLATFVEELRALPSIESVTTPAFVRIDDPASGPHSPFDITLALR
jgi:hypothetical protein